MRKFNIVIRNSVTNGNTLELQFLDVIYDGWDWDTWTEIKVVQDVITKVQNAKPSVIKLTIDSEGGDASIGLAVYNFLLKYATDNNVTIEVEIIGMAGSIASVIAMCATKGNLRMAKNAFMVIHRAWGSGWGNSEDLRAAADVIDQYTERIVDIYAQRTGISTEDINGYIANGDFWMTGTKAIELGFADELFNDNEQFAIAARIGSLDPNYKNVPKNLVKPANEIPDGESGDPAHENTLQTIKNEFMKFKDRVNAFIESLKGKTIDNKVENLALEVANVISEPMASLAEGLQEEVTNHIAEQKTAIINELKEAITKEVNASIKTDMDAIKKENEDLKTEIANLVGTETKKDPKTENKVSVGAFRKD